jgi:hypothetical protein
MELFKIVEPYQTFIYLDTWIEQLLQYPKFAVLQDSGGCDKELGCESYFLPGSLEDALLARAPVLTSLLESTLSSSPNSIRIYNAPGIGLMFQPVPESNVFNNLTDCTTFIVDDSGEQSGLQVCGKQAGQSVLFGMCSFRV